jgi:hypothetical protein
MAAQQLALDLSQPINHHERLHGAAHGTVIYWERRAGKDRWSKVEPGDPVQQLISGLAGVPDTFISANQFHGWRLVRLIKSLRACYVDIDGSIDLEEALALLQAARIPAPSFVVYSGRGMHLYWLLQPTPGQALPVWQRVQDVLIKALASIGADPAARDCARMLRLVGTTHSKSGNEVRGVVLTDTLWSLHELADEVLGAREAKRSTVHDLAAAGARKGRSSGRNRWQGSIYGWWHLVYRDMVTIAEYKWPNGVPPGYRDRVLFIMAVALSWFCEPTTLQNEIMTTARDMTPTLDEHEITQTMAPILKRAAMRAAGEHMHYNGKDYDPRYNYSAQGLRDYLADIIPVELHSQLRALAPAEVILQRKKERDLVRDRVAEGRYKQTRETYLQGVQDKAASARLLKAQGKTAKEIAEVLGVSRMTISRYLKEGVTSAPSLYSPPEGRDVLGVASAFAFSEGDPQAAGKITK